MAAWFLQGLIRSVLLLGQPQYPVLLVPEEFIEGLRHILGHNPPRLSLVMLVLSMIVPPVGGSAVGDLCLG